MNFTSVVKLIDDLHKTGFVVKVNGSMDSVVVEHLETKIKSYPLYSHTEAKTWAAGFLARHKKGN
jgi:SOS-response transcriptional repressor LexA